VRKFLTDWWLLIVIAIAIWAAMSGGSGSRGSSQPQTRGDIQNALQQDAQQAYEEQDYRGQ
jgi:hypothetical protein